MRSFKRFLAEEVSHFLKTREEIVDFLRDKRLIVPTIHDDLTLEFHGETLSVNGNFLDREGYLPFQFVKVRNLFINDAPGMKSLIGCPKLVNNVEIKMKGLELTDLVGMPEKVTEVCKIVDFGGQIKTLRGITKDAHTYRNYLSGVTSYHNVHKEIKHIGNLIEISEVVKDSLLGMVLIDGQFTIICGTKTEEAPLKKAIDKINEYVFYEKHKRPDILDCQEELFDLGVKQYAQL